MDTSVRTDSVIRFLDSTLSDGNYKLTLTAWRKYAPDELSFADYGALLPQADNLRKNNFNPRKAFVYENATLKNELLKLGTGKSDPNVTQDLGFNPSYCFPIRIVRPEIIDAFNKMSAYDNFLAEMD